MIRHHLSDDLLTGYCAGSQPEAFNVLIATHVSLCDECRARLASLDALGGALLESAGPVEMGAGALAATLARIKGQPPMPISAVVRPAGLFPEPLRARVGGDLDAVRWRAVGGGVRQAILPTSGRASLRLLHIPGGGAVPDHGHKGTELTLVLQGAFSDESDRFGPGDVEIADAEVHHTPVAEPGPACICLAATDAPLRFKGLVPRLVQPFVKI